MKRRRRRKKRGRLWIVPGIALSGALLLAYFTCQKRQPPAPHIERRTPPHRATEALEIVRVIQRQGGEDVWVRRGSFGLDSFSVIALPAAYARILLATEAEAQRKGLTVQIGSRPGGHAEGATAVLLERRGRVVCRFRLAETARIIRASIVIDDLGENMEAARRLIALPSPLTLSIMPHLPYSHLTADEAHRAGHEVMLHLPMQPVGSNVPNTSPDELRVGMPKGEIDRIIQGDLASVPWVGGVDNHMGSRATADPRLMRQVMSELAPRRLYFIDSVTTPRSVAYRTARQFGIPSFYRSVFLDDSRTVPYTLNQLQQLCRLAKKNGAALAIGHPYPSTLRALALFLPEFNRENIQLVPASWLARKPSNAVH